MGQSGNCYGCLDCLDGAQSLTLNHKGPIMADENTKLTTPATLAALATQARLRTGLEEVLARHAMPPPTPADLEYSRRLAEAYRRRRVAYRKRPHRPPEPRAELLVVRGCAGQWLPAAQAGGTDSSSAGRDAAAAVSAAPGLAVANSGCQT